MFSDTTILLSNLLFLHRKKKIQKSLTLKMVVFLEDGELHVISTTIKGNTKSKEKRTIVLSRNSQAIGDQNR
jgi:hypothetical protein